MLQQSEGFVGGNKKIMVPHGSFDQCALHVLYI